MKTEAGRKSPQTERAFLIVPVEGQGGRAQDDRLEEARGLVEALDLDLASAALAPLRRRSPRAFFGQGRIDALKDEMAACQAGVLIVDAALSPVQQRNLELGLGAKVLDRTGLILEIFGRRARSREGVLQVELARQAYERSRLVRTWTHLERQRGGLGKTGGPGETQIEIDRRLIAERIDRLKAQLVEVRRTRGLQRRARRRSGMAAAALIGYTNAGKSTLFNRLTQASVLAQNMPFATLDPTARLVRLPLGREVILSDTVGFISDLPTELVESFRATLEELTSADVLIHVRDIAHRETDAQRDDVMAVLDQVFDGAAMPPIIEVWNKIDQLPPDALGARVHRAQTNAQPIVTLSALTGEGVSELLRAIEQAAFGPVRIVDVWLDPSDGRRRAVLAERGRILEEQLEDNGLLRITVEAAAADLTRPEFGEVEPRAKAAE